MRQSSRTMLAIMTRYVGCDRRGSSSRRGEKRTQILTLMVAGGDLSDEAARR